MDNDIIRAESVSYVYKSRTDKDDDLKALSNVNINIEKGQFVVVLGRNGSGKSTLSRLMNALLLPTEGVVYVAGLDTRDENALWEIRRSAGMVFQNPDNQIVGTVVEEDVAFGPENIGVPPEEIRERVDQSLKSVGLFEYRDNAPHLLSGGQKQKVAIAGVLAMKPECIIFDEATSMLDPVGRKEVMHTIKSLNKDDKITIIHITHHMDEAALSDRVIVIEEGSIIMDDTPKRVFSEVENIKSAGLDVPQVTELFNELNKEGCKLPDDILTVEEAFDILRKELLTK
ncbi:energy-coupling factor transport system ATP-binding protein [Anaerobacterium chartisolvens]|uniref:Energy-coupling factor transport system ATP-binding protein n=1 Tax=Anaerobacterium chartisolvens TaxID=1297424 RepID=A0A369AUP3_9FIRM|nr:energy-coupling factor transporter ATPase [Anaerobacterium chartisolvens]RCX12763.1 energy-coupling factor transport system ATP-binding protein [Anaerobacterium chartisolvens]